MSRRCLLAPPLVLWTLTLTSTGCHRIFPFDVQTGQGDARAVDASVVDAVVVVDGGGGPEVAPDAAADTLPHVPTFAAPVPVPGPVNSAWYDDGPHLSLDGKRLYFSSDRPGGTGLRDIWVASRPSLADAFGAPEPVPGVNGVGDESDPSLSADELIIVFERQSALYLDDLYIATRSSTSEAFSTPQAMDELNTMASDGDPGLGPEGTELYFASNRTAGWQIWVAKRGQAAGPFDPPSPVPELNGPYVDYDPSLFGASYLVMVSERPGQGGDDLFMALRPDPNSPFGAPVHLPGVSSALDESDPYFHAGLGLLLFFRAGDIHWSTVK